MTNSGVDGTYGEVEWDGMRTIMEKLGTSSTDVFYDIGFFIYTHYPSS